VDPRALERPRPLRLRRTFLLAPAGRCAGCDRRGPRRSRRCRATRESPGGQRDLRSRPGRSWTPGTRCAPRRSVVPAPRPCGAHSLRVRVAVGPFRVHPTRTAGSPARRRRRADGGGVAASPNDDRGTRPATTGSAGRRARPVGRPPHDDARSRTEEAGGRPGDDGSRQHATPPGPFSCGVGVRERGGFRGPAVRTGSSTDEGGSGGLRCGRARPAVDSGHGRAASAHRFELRLDTPAGREREPAHHLRRHAPDGGDAERRHHREHCL
jgi:hypothetical protein